MVGVAVGESMGMNLAPLELAENPASVESLFSAGGSYTPGGPASPGDVQFAFSTDLSQSGSYAVSISQSAAQASDLGSVGFSSSASTVPR